MEFFRQRTDIPFMRHALKFNLFSSLAFVLAVFFIVLRGLNLSVEFTGGTLIEVGYAEPPRIEDIRQALARDGYPDAQVQNFGSAREILIRMPNREDLDTSRISERVMATLQATEGPQPELRRVEFVGPQVGKELATDGAMALLL
ncbi:MAG TPA: protein translocase subunit SecF, partial [Thauera sp.]|nr:protein translocase subunit SecF [Thauera sp.]